MEIEMKGLDSFEDVSQIKDELEEVEAELSKLGKSNPDSDYENLDWYRVELESAIEEEEKFNKEMEADIDSNRY